MIIKYLSTFLTVILTSISSASTPIGDSYTISMPLHIDLCDSGSFNVEVVDNNLSDDDTIDLYFDDSFVLSDIHGKPDVTGSITNSHISFNSSDQTTKTVYYDVGNLGVGQWRGNINVSISLDRKAQGNILLDGKTINSILNELNPTTISFSHSEIAGNYLYDLSTAQDESILLYKNGNEVIITNKINEPIMANEDMSNLFRNVKASSINHLEYIDMSNCTNMSSMFEWCSNLNSLDVSSFNTSNVVDMSYMFENMQTCKSLIGLENFDVTNVETIAHLICHCYGLTSVPDLSGWTITDKCKDISYAFAGVAYQNAVKNTSKWPESYDLSNWDVSNVTNMAYAFSNAFSLKSLDLSGWNTSNVVDMNSMFRMEDSINKSQLVTVYGLENFNVSNVTDMSFIFYQCRQLAVDLSSWNPTNLEKLDKAFYDTRYLNLRPLEAWSDIIANNAVTYSDCFNNYSGYYTERNYKPSWYK